AAAPAAADTGYATGGAAAEDRQPMPHAAVAAAACRGTFPNSRKQFSVVAAAPSCGVIPFARARASAVWTTWAGSLVLPRYGAGARNGASVSTSTRSSGTSAAIA